MRMIRTTAIIGAGALGATYASLLYAADATSVWFIASDERHQQLQRTGVTVNGTTSHIPVLHPEKATPADLLLVAVKHHHLDQAIKEMKQAIGPDTTILSVMNGIDSEERISAVYGPEKVVYGLTLGIDAVRHDNTVQYTNQGKILFGEKLNPDRSERVQQISELFTRAGIDHDVPCDMLRTLWYKYMINVGVNQVSAVMGLTYGAVRESDTAKELMDAAMREVISIAQALQINLGEEDIIAWYKVLQSLGAENKTSMLQDVEAGRQTEVEMLAGTVINLGGKLGIPTPVNQLLYGKLTVVDHPDTNSIESI